MVTKTVQSILVLVAEFARKALGISQYQIGHVLNVVAVRISHKQTIVQLARVLDGRGDLARTVPGNIIEEDILLARGESVATDLKGIVDGSMSDLVADHMVKAPSIGMPHPLLSRLFGETLVR